MQHDIISNRIVTALNTDILLIDTAHASSNEHYIRHGIDIAYQEIIKEQEQQEDENENEMPKSLPSDKIIDIHIITKVWYTYLGYNRTIVSVQESLQELHKTQLKKDDEDLLLAQQNTKTNVRLNVHVLLHWPRCRTDIEWMDCTNEEMNLPLTIRQLGPNPNNDPNLFLQSWKALEDLYYYNTELVHKPVHEISPQPSSTKLRGGNPHYYEDSYHQPITSNSDSTGSGRILNTINDSSNDPFEARIASIGVSNFDINDLSLLLQHSRIPPHIVQDNVWTYIFHPQLITLLEQHGIHYQAYNVMNGIIHNYEKCPNTYHTLERIGTKVLSEAHHLIALNNNQDEDEDPIPDIISPTQLVLSWLVHQNVSIIPRSSTAEHMYENSPHSLYPYINVWNLLRDSSNDQEMYPILSNYVQKSIGSLLRQEDFKMIEIIFDNSNEGAIPSTMWLVYWVNIDEINEDGSNTIDHIQYITKIYPGKIFRTGTHPEHTFLVIPYENDNNNQTSDSEDIEPILPTEVFEELVLQHQTTYTVSVEYGEEETFYLPLTIPSLSDTDANPPTEEYEDEEL